MTLDDLEQL